MESFSWVDGGAQGRLAAFLHLPETKGPHGAVLFCHGFTGTRVEPQRLFLAFARRLALQGVSSLRFDFGGHGESEGVFERLTLDGEIQDASAAWKFLKAQPGVDPGRMGLLGFSLGGWVAASLAGSLPSLELKALALWAPVDDPARLKLRFMGLHGSEQLQKRGSVDVMAERLGAVFAEGLDRYRGMLPGGSWRGPTLLVHGERDESVPPAAAESYESTYTKRGCPFLRKTLPGARHLFETPGQREKLYQETESFLRGALNP